MAFRGLQSESAAQGQVHMTVSKELKDLVADPFAQWASGHKVGTVRMYTVRFNNITSLRIEYMAVRIRSSTDG